MERETESEDTGAGEETPERVWGRAEHPAGRVVARGWPRAPSGLLAALAAVVTPAHWALCPCHGLTISGVKGIAGGVLKEAAHREKGAVT